MMPLLHQTRRRDDITDLENLVDRCIDEVAQVVGSTPEHMSRLQITKIRLMRLRIGFAQAREGIRVQSA
jgi:hypothetical protein